MTGRDPGLDGGAARLREQAEHELVRQAPGAVALPDQEPSRLLHELQLHQIELELQNEELMRSLAALDAEKARYLDLYESAPYGDCELDEQGVIVQANAMAVRLLLSEAPALVGQAMSGFLAPHERDAFDRFRLQAATGGHVEASEFQMERLDGSRWWAQLEARGARHRAVTPTLRIMFSDIDQRKRADEALRIAAVAFESGAGIMVTDANGAIVSVNQSFTDITGYSAEEVLGRDPRMLGSGGHEQAFFVALWESVHATGKWQGEIRNRRKNGEVYTEWLAISAVRNDAGQTTHYVGTFNDITVRKTAEDAIRDLAYFDVLTRLPNRRMVMERLTQAQVDAVRLTRCGALIFIDIDNFKAVNDTLGHDHGDRLLKQVADRLQNCVRDADTVARLGGDEFVVVIEGLNGLAPEAIAQAGVVAEKIRRALDQSYQVASHVHHSSVSIGVTLFGELPEPVDEPLKRGDLAMYQAKAMGRNRVCLFEPRMLAEVKAKAQLESDLREAITLGQFEVFYQPQVIDQGYLVGGEALLRWRRPERGLILPGDFIGLAEETGLIVPLGHWVLQRVCELLARWASHPRLGQLSLAVNVSATQFRQADFVQRVIEVLAHSGAPPHRLKLELTESLLVSNAEEVMVKMQLLKQRGVAFSLDDFGTGYSSLAYLKRLPLDQLKIDQGFVHDLETSANDASIARMVIALGDSLGLDVIAEGVETVAQRDFLAEHGCHIYQGYLFGRPVCLQEFEAAALTG